MISFVSRLTCRLMRRFVFNFVLCFGVLSFIAVESLTYADSTPSSTPSSSELQSISRSVFRVFSINSKTNSVAKGSGFFILEKGALLTNYHVIEGGDAFAIFVVNSSGTGAAMLDAIPVAVDKENDLALLHVDGDNLPEPFQISQKEPQILQKVIAVGFPGGVDIYKAAPNSSLVNRLTGGMDNLIPNVTQGNISKITSEMIVHDCKIGPGSSGGPLLDAETGEIIGVNFAGKTDQALVTFFFAIPAHKIQSFLTGETGEKYITPQPPIEEEYSSTNLSKISTLSGDDVISYIVEEHIKGGLASNTISEDLYEDIIYYGAESKQMTKYEYVKDSLIYNRNWPVREYKIISVSRDGNTVSIIFQYKCRSKKGKLAQGFSHLNLYITRNMKIGVIEEKTSSHLPLEYPRYVPVNYRGKRFFSTRIPISPR